jgi:hypothetical protein
MARGGTAAPFTRRPADEREYRRRDLRHGDRARPVGPHIRRDLSCRPPHMHLTKPGRPVTAWQHPMTRQGREQRDTEPNGSAGLRRKAADCPSACRDQQDDKEPPLRRTNKQPIASVGPGRQNRMICAWPAARWARRPAAPIRRSARSMRPRPLGGSLPSVTAVGFTADTRAGPGGPRHAGPAVPGTGRSDASTPAAGVTTPQRHARSPGPVSAADSVPAAPEAADPGRQQPETYLACGRCS